MTCSTYYHNEISHRGAIHLLRVDMSTGHCDLQCVGIECKTTMLQNTYDSVDAMPLPIKRKLAALLTTRPESNEVVGVGLRVTENEFWIYE